MIKRATSNVVFYIVLALILSSGVASRDNPAHAASTQSQYTDYTEKDKSAVFVERFDNNSNNWKVGGRRGTGRRAKVAFGTYLIESLRQGVNPVSVLPVKIDQGRNFEIEASFRYVRGETNNANCLVWGMNANSHRFRFGISGNGQFIIDKYDGSWHNFKPWTESPLVNRTGYNKLTVRKTDQVYSFFLNEQFVYSMPFRAFFGTKVGFQVNQKTAIQVDSLKVSYLKRTRVNNPPRIVLSEPDLARGIKTVSTPRVRITGQALDPDGIQEVQVNGTLATLQRNGYFSVEVPLSTGESQITIKATDTRMKSAYKTILVSRESAEPVGMSPEPEAGWPASSTDTLRPDVASRADERRLALLIGNANYLHGGSLVNPVNDVRSMEKSLQRLGFTVVKHENCDQKTLKRAMDDFGQQLAGVDVGLFFYAGHGIQVNGNNYLIPTDARIQNEGDTEYDCVRADRILAKMEAAGTRTNIVILDACRDNPFERSWHRGSKGSGLAFMNAPAGSLIAYATSPGSTASDGTGKNSFYTSALLDHMGTPDITILQMFQRVRDAVIKQSGNTQTPWESTSLRGDFYLYK